jgi:hypothetical protein
MTRVFLSTLMFAALPLATADEAKPKGTDLPIKAKLIAKKTAHTLDLGGKTAEDYKKALKEGEKSGKLPPAPAVELELELTNTSAKDVAIYTTGDPVMVEFVLKGPGAVTLKPLLAVTREFRVPRSMTLAAGKTYSIKLNSLRAGFRGISELSYWTEPGEYTLSANFRTGINPAPEGTKADDKGFGEVTLKSEPVTIKVEKK